MVTYQLFLGPELDWLLDDTEEALLGTSVHQYTITNLYGDLTSYRDDAGLPWFIGNQLKLIIPRRDGRPPYYPSPDIVIHATLGDIELSSLSFARYGPAALAIEIASPATAYGHDLDTVDPEAKPLAYAQGGIPEYLAFDPTGKIIAEIIRAWRMGRGTHGSGSGVYVPWLPDPATGRWHSALGSSFAPQGILLRVYAPDGTLILTRAELAAALRAQAQEVEALRAELRRRNDE